MQAYVRRLPLFAPGRILKIRKAVFLARITLFDELRTIGSRNVKEQNRAKVFNFSPIYA